MKSSLLSRLSVACLFVVASVTGAMAQKVVYSEQPVVASSGYWTLETDKSVRDYTVVSFFNDQHELLYQERLNGVCLAPCKSAATHRRMARMLGTTLQQVQRLQSNSMVSTRLLASNRMVQRTYAAR